MGVGVGVAVGGQVHRRSRAERALRAAESLCVRSGSGQVQRGCLGGGEAVAGVEGGEGEPPPHGLGSRLRVGLGQVQRGSRDVRARRAARARRACRRASGDGQVHRGWRVRPGGEGRHPPGPPSSFSHE